MKSLSFGRSLLLLFLTFAVFSCAYESQESTVQGSEEEREITLQIAVPGVQSSALRALQEKDENRIQSIDVLVFDANDNYDYYARARKVNNYEDGEKIQSMGVVMRIKASQRLVVITNAETAVAGLLASRSWQGTSKNEMLSQLVFALPAGSVWNTNTSTDNYALPMWGESGRENITSTTVSLSAPVQLLRMIAKVDVQVDKQKVTTAQFRLKEVYVYNSYTSGRIAPDPSALSADRMCVDKPSLPANAQTYRKVKYSSDNNAFDPPGEASVAMRGAIYLFESAVPSNKDRDKVTGLVIGGEYQGDTKITYYRVDFLKDDTFRDVLRNFRYDINIVGVDGQGYDNADEAWENKAVNMTCEILQWDDSKMGEFVLDGQYYLSVNRGEFLFFKEGESAKRPDNTLVVRTDYRDGWKIKAINYPTDTPWLTIKDDNGNYDLNAHGDANTNMECALTYADNNTLPQKEREAEIVIVAGRLEYTVKIRQNTLPRAKLTFRYDAARIEITNDTLVFEYVPGEDARRDLHVEWEPSYSDLVAYEMPLEPSVPWLRTEIPSGLKFLRNGTFSPAGQYSYLIGVSKDHVRGAATSFVFSVSNGGQSTERRLILYYP